MKKCCTCGEVKPFSDFHKANKRKCGHAFSCKQCVKVYHKEFYLINKEKIDIRNKQWYENNKEQRSESCRKYYINNKIKYKENGKRWETNNPDKRRALGIKADNRKKLIPRYRMNSSFSRSIRKALKGNILNVKGL